VLSTIFLYAAMIGGLLLLLQVAMMIVGLDDGGLGDSAGADNESVTDASGLWFFEMLSLRTLSAAACFFGLAGKASLAAGQAPLVAMTIALLAGYGALYSVFWLFRQVLRLETSGNEDLRDSVGSMAQVYVPIAPAGGPAGKIQMAWQGRTVECQAVTDHAERLPTGAQVVVLEVLGDDIVKVGPLDT
jgi:hypothetical protein